MHGWLSKTATGWVWRVVLPLEWWRLVEVVSRTCRVSVEFKVAGRVVTAYWDGDDSRGGWVVEAVASRQRAWGGTVAIWPDADLGVGVCGGEARRRDGGLAEGSGGGEETVLIE